MAERYAVLSYSIILGRNCVDNIFVVFREIRLLDFSESGSKCGRFRSSVEGPGGEGRSSIYDKSRLERMWGIISLGNLVDVPRDRRLLLKQSYGETGTQRERGEP